jgi:hypothetical protein
MDVLCRVIELVLLVITLIVWGLALGVVALVLS